MSNNLSFEEIRSRFAKHGLGEMVFEILDHAKFVAGVSLEALPEFGSDDALDQMIGQLDADVSPYEMLFSGKVVA